jgi:hypothetical protein
MGKAVRKDPWSILVAPRHWPLRFPSAPPALVIFPAVFVRLSCLRGRGVARTNDEQGRFSGVSSSSGRIVGGEWWPSLVSLTWSSPAGDG